MMSFCTGLTRSYDVLLVAFAVSSFHIALMVLALARDNYGRRIGVSGRRSGQSRPSTAARWFIRPVCGKVSRGASFGFTIVAG